MVAVPVIETVNYSRKELDIFIGDIRRAKSTDMGQESYLLEYPTVYIIHDKKCEGYHVYVGETSDIYSRTKQHLISDSRSNDEWNDFSKSPKSKMYIVGHELFNKSLTLDIENRLMLYLGSVDSVGKIRNRRSNPQGKYYTHEYLDEVFSKIWNNLHERNGLLFPSEESIKESALFKSSPFHRLTAEQIEAKDNIIQKIKDSLSQDCSEFGGRLILVGGEAGTGKTVLLSNLFHDLFRMEDHQGPLPISGKINPYLLVNHDEQLAVYRQIGKKLGWLQNNEDRISKPTRFIRLHGVASDSGQYPEDFPDVVIVDEAHLLLTQGKQSYRGKNQLFDILHRAKIVVAVFDPMQVMATNQYWTEEEYQNIRQQADEEIILKNQMRMNAARETVDWVRSIIDRGEVLPLSLNGDYRDKNNYEVRVFQNPQDMYNKIYSKASVLESKLSRLLATFDWSYSGVKGKGGKVGEVWAVEIGDFSLPWNREIIKKGSLSKAEKRKAEDQAWAEQEHTINEVGSTFTIHGFDLNYAGVIIGESVKYRNGQIIFDPCSSKNRNATQRRTLSNGVKVSVAEELLRNELNVLLTRGVNGLYIYAVDDELRKVLSENVYNI
ncbi:DUF2075 domain-containing protein [Corynebacterium mastitidis]|uniref:DUF2075 domain-containing protein n=1 Tax=Corynebacterium mastitidis TaxID=161890 RepID=UPI00039A1430|nr:DUF2075 domain-containing protein [Corynebacterium mastitidis]